jgi:hypothetical protein
MLDINNKPIDDKNLSDIDVLLCQKCTELKDLLKSNNRQCIIITNAITKNGAKHPCGFWSFHINGTTPEKSEEQALNALAGFIHMISEGKVGLRMVDDD